MPVSSELRAPGRVPRRTNKSAPTPSWRSRIARHRVLRFATLGSRSSKPASAVARTTLRGRIDDQRLDWISASCCTTSATWASRRRHLATPAAARSGGAVRRGHSRSTRRARRQPSRGGAAERHVHGPSRTIFRNAFTLDEDSDIAGSLLQHLRPAPRGMFSEQRTADVEQVGHSPPAGQRPYRAGMAPR